MCMSNANEQESFDFYDILVEQKPQSLANISVKFLFVSGKACCLVPKMALKKLFCVKILRFKHKKHVYARLSTV
jgi:hypothetical protein